MIARLVLRDVLRGKARAACAILGIAAAAGCVIFTQSLKATNSAQGFKRAERIMAPWVAWTDKTAGNAAGRQNLDKYFLLAACRHESYIHRAEFSAAARPADARFARLRGEWREHLRQHSP